MGYLAELNQTIKELPGLGMICKSDQNTYYVGNPRLLADYKITVPKEIEEWTSEALAWQDLTVQDKETGKTRWIFQQPNASFRSGGDQLLGNGNWQKASSLNGLDADHCLDRIRRESDRFLERLGYRREEGVYRILRPSEERVALFCHQGFSMGWFPHLLNIPPHIFWSAFDVNHSGVTLFEFKNYPNNITAPKCLCFSDVSHFLKEGLPLRFSNGVRM